MGKSGGVLYQQPQPDTNGKYHLLFTAGRETTSDDWLVEIYDTAGDKPVKVYSRAIASSFGSISYIDFVRSYSTGITAITVDDIVVKTDNSYEVDRSVTFDEDFSKYSAGPYTPAEGGITTEQLSGAGSFEITPSGALKATTLAADSRITMRYNFPNPVNKGVLTSTVTVDNNETVVADAYSSWTFFVLYNDAGLQTSITKYKDGGLKDKENNVLSPQPQIVDGKYHLQYIARRESAQDNWIVEIYDVAGAKPFKVYSGLIDKSFGNIKSIDIVRSYGATTAANTIAVDDISIRTYNSYEADRDFECDFDTLEGANTSAQISAATGISFVDDAATVEVKDGALKLSHINANEKVNLKYSIPAIEKGTLSFSAKFGQDGTKDDGAWFISNFYNGTKKSSDLIHRYGIESYRWSANEKESLDVTKNAETEMYHIRTVVSRADKVSPWTVTIWDDGGKSSKLVRETTLSAEDFAKIDAISIANSYSLGATNLIVDDVAINYTEGIYVDGIAFKNGDEIVDNIVTGMTELTAQVKIHSLNANENALTVVLGVYSSEGRLIGVSALPINDLTANSKEYSVTANGFIADADSYAKVFFLENINSIIPVRANGGLFSEGFQF